MFLVGIDVASSRKGQSVAFLTPDLLVEDLWSHEPADGLMDRILNKTGDQVIVAIDAPRKPANNPSGKWGRACERELHRRGIRVQWTPNTDYFERPESDSKEWMRIGFRLFEEVGRLLPSERIIEVFPSASYGRFLPRDIRIPFNLLDRRAKADQLDAVCCALTGYCFNADLYEAVGDPDEDRIIIPSSEAIR